MIKMKLFAAAAMLSVGIGTATVNFNAPTLQSGSSKETEQAWPMQKNKVFGKTLSSKIKLSAQQSKILALVEVIAEENMIDAGDLAALVWVESRFNPTAKSPFSSASGLCQFISSTGSQYGLTNPLDARANLSACAALWKANGGYFERRIGRKPSGSMQYLMHQQGAGTAVMMVLAGDRLAKTVSSRQAIALNLPGREPDTVTARAFVEFWQVKFDLARANFAYE